MLTISSNTQKYIIHGHAMKLHIQQIHLPINRTLKPWNALVYNMTYHQ